LPLVQVAVGGELAEVPQDRVQLCRAHGCTLWFRVPINVVPETRSIPPGFSAARLAVDRRSTRASRHASISDRPLNGTTPRPCWSARRPGRLSGPTGAHRRSETRLCRRTHGTRSRAAAPRGGTGPPRLS